VGTTTTDDSRTYGGASSWSTPIITCPSTTIIVKSGANSATTINWFAEVRFLILGD